jgi:hypothetical protein
MLIFGSGQKMVSGFLPDILCIPVDSPRVSLRSMRIDDHPVVFTGVCRTANSSGRFHKNTRKNGMLGNARYVFQNFD